MDIPDLPFEEKELFERLEEVLTEVITNALRKALNETRWDSQKKMPRSERLARLAAENKRAVAQKALKAVDNKLEQLA